ncbi:zinc finger protein 335 [Gastrophryne carolinensis]
MPVAILDGLLLLLRLLRIRRVDLCLAMEAGINGDNVVQTTTDKMPEDTIISMHIDGTNLEIPNINSSGHEGPTTKNKKKVALILPSTIKPELEAKTDGDLEADTAENFQQLNQQALEASPAREVTEEILLIPADKNHEQLEVQQSPISKALQEVTRCLGIGSQDLEPNTDAETTPEPGSSNLNIPESSLHEAARNFTAHSIVLVADPQSINIQETFVKDNQGNVANDENSVTSARIESATKGVHMVPQAPAVIMHHDYAAFFVDAWDKDQASLDRLVSLPEQGAMPNTPLISCPATSCSVPGVCSICQSLLTQSPQTVVLPSEVSGAVYAGNSVDRIIHGSINSQLIQDCIVASSGGSNSEITQYLILQERENVSNSYPMTVSAVDGIDVSQCGAPVTGSDLEALEGMMEVVVVQQYKCKMCLYKSASKSTLLRHVKERHMPTANKDETVSRKVARPREEEEEEEDDIVDAGAIDDPYNDSDYSPGDDSTRNQQPGSANVLLAKERPRRRPGRPRKVPRVQGPEQVSGPHPVPVAESKAEVLVVLSDAENKDPSPCTPQEEQKPPTRPRGRPPKHFRSKKYRRYRSRRYYKPPSKPLLRPFICHVCGSRFLTQQDYTFHVNAHDGNDPQLFRCQQCNYQCRRWSSLKEHMFNHQGSKPHKCDQCDYTSVYKKDVIRHSAVHRPEQKKKQLLMTQNTTYPCPICNRVYSMQKRLTQHMKSHSSEKPHMCDKCGKAFKKKYTFKMHLLTHLHCVDESRYKCEFCEYVCEDRKQLLNHQLTHMNDKPFKCNQCKYHTFRQDFLLSHQATKHAAGKPFACEYCHFTTKHKKNLRLHVQCRHTNLYQEWAQRHPEEAPCRRRPFFSHQQIEELKQQHEQPGFQPPAITLSESQPKELTYHMLHSQAQGEGQAENTLEGATIIYEQGGEGDELATQAALDLLLNMSAQRDGGGGPLQVAVVKSVESQPSDSASQEPLMAQVLTLHMDERQVSHMQEVGFEESSESHYEENIQPVPSSTAFTSTEYSLVNAEGMQVPLCSNDDTLPKSQKTQLTDSGKDQNSLQILKNPPQQSVAANQAQAPPTTKKFSCKICNSAFWGRSEMETHKKSHIEGESGFKCPDCNFTAEAWPLVRDHMSLHSDLRPHRCNQCSFASKNKKDLSRHAMTHTNHRPHICHLCGQRFNRKGHLKFHIQRLHTGACMEQPEQTDLTTAPAPDEEHIFLTQEETISNQENTAYIQEITTADGQTLQQLVTTDNQVQYIISQEGVPHLIPQEYVVLPEGHHIQVQDGQITHIQYEPGGSFLQDPQIHFVPMSPSQQLLTQEELEAAARNAVTAVADAAMAQTVYTTEAESALQQEIQYDVITLAE